MESTHVGFAEQYENVLPRIVANAKEADRRVVQAVRERPLWALGVALLAGYLIGRVASRVG